MDLAMIQAHKRIGNLLIIGDLRRVIPQDLMDQLDSVTFPKRVVAKEGMPNKAELRAQALLRRKPNGGTACGTGGGMGRGRRPGSYK